MIRLTHAIAIAAAALAVPVSAQTPDVLACMDSGYSPEDQALMDAYVADFSFETMDGSDELAMALGWRATECGAGSLEDDASVMAMIMYRLADLSMKGIAKTRPDIVAVIGRIDTQLPAENRARFYAIFEDSVFAAKDEDQPRAITPEEDEFFSNTILDPPVNGTMEQAEMIGAYLAARILRQEAIDQFSAR